ncbi:MAG: hypothetical protein U9Q07_11475, partial [Planctomycetota bacterium]|nr:hypothetical protein [Planctomycetota bacterium]
RMNGWGYALGTLGGMLLSLLALLFNDAPVYYVFPSICLASLLVSIIASLATRPVDRDILVDFYKSVRPFGLWKPVATLNEDRESSIEKQESVSRTVLNVVLAMLAIMGLYLFPMYFVGHWYTHSMLWLALAVAAIIALKYTWYRFLPEPGNDAN